MTNTIIVSHTTGILVTPGNTATLNASLWYGNLANWDGTGTIQHSGDIFDDPAFDADGYHLTSASAALGTGVNAGVRTDIDDHDRPQGTGYDLGADEYCIPISAVNINGPIIGTIGRAYVFSATITPSDAGTPITYAWLPEPVSGQGTTNASYLWNTAGAQVISLSASNGAEVITDTHTIAIEAHIYLPLILK
jgi:hypothetical protein